MNSFLYKGIAYICYTFHILPSNYIDPYYDEMQGYERFLFDLDIANLANGIFNNPQSNSVEATVNRQIENWEL